MSLQKRLAFGCLFGGAFLSAGAAQAQFLDLDIKTSHSAYAAGLPQAFATTATTQSNGQPTAFGGVAAVEYSMRGFFANGAPANGVTLEPTDDIGRILAVNPNLSLVPGSAARASELKVFVPDAGDGSAPTFSVPANFEVFGDCRVNRGFNDRVGLPLETSVDVCDAIDATLRLNGVTFRLTGGQDKVPLRLEIPEVGYDFTANPATPPATAADQFIRRHAVKRLLRDNFYASGKVNTVAARLLGKPDGFMVPTKVLPNEGKLVTGEITVGGVTKTFGVDNPGQALAYVLVNRGNKLSDFGLPYAGSCFRSAVGGPVTGTCTAGAAVVRVAGMEITATTTANSPDVTFSAPDLNLSFTSSGAVDRDDAGEQFFRYAQDNVASEDLTRAYARFRAATDPSDPLVGNPFSAQGQLNRATLDLDSPSEALDESKDSGGGQRSRADDPSGWMVGGRAGYLSAGHQSAEFVDAVFERGFRIREGSRMRLKVSAPLSYINYGSRRKGGQTAAFGLRTSLEAPLIDGRWVVEPSAAISGFYSDNNVSSGALYSFGVSSRYKIAPIGRGHLVIGNAVNYSSTLEINAGSFASPKITNTAVRNGLAYQVPYGRFLGRQGTVRASYTYTHLFGDQVLVDDYHEVSISYGVAGREAAVKQIGETLRFGLNGGFGHDFTAVSLTAGYRF